MNAKRTGRGLARSIVAVATACATGLGFVVPVQSAPSATGSATVTQKLAKDQEVRTAVAKEQTFTVTSTLKWTNTSGTSAKPQSLAQITDPAPGVVADKVVFSSDSVGGAKLLSAGNHNGVQSGDGNTWTVPAKAFTDVAPGETASASVTVTYRITDLVLATQKGNRWCDDHGLKTTAMIGDTESNTVCTNIKFPNLALTRTTGGGTTKRSTVTIAKGQKTLDFTYIIENTGSSNLQALRLSDRALLLNNSGRATRGEGIDLTGISCEGKAKDGKTDLQLKVTLSGDKRTANIDFVKESVFANSETVTCTLKGVPVSALEFDHDAASQLLVVDTEVQPDAGQPLGATYGRTERLATTLFKQEGAQRFDTKLSAGTNPAARVLDGSDGQLFATTMELSLTNVSSNYAATPRGITIDPSGIAKGLQIHSVTLTPLAADQADNKLVGGVEELTRAEDGTWWLAQDINQIGAKRTKRALLTIVASVAEVPDKSTRKCDGSDGHGVRISADTESGDPASACVDLAVAGASLKREIANNRNNTYIAAPNADAPFDKLKQGQKAWFKWTVTNTGETNLGTVYVTDYLLNVVADKVDVPTEVIVPEGLECSGTKAVTKEGNRFKAELPVGGLAPGGSVSCTYKAGLVPDWQDNRYQTRSDAQITSLRDKTQVVDGKDLQAVTAQSVVYARQPGPDVIVSGISNSGDESSRNKAVVATKNGQKIAVTWLVNVRNLDRLQARTSDDLNLEVSARRGMKLEKITVSPLGGRDENSEDNLVTGTHDLGTATETFIPSDIMQEIGPVKVRAANVTAVYTVTDIDQLQENKQQLTCPAGGLQLTVGSENKCRSVSTAKFSGDVRINGGLKKRLTEKKPATVTYTIKNDGTSDLAKLQLWDTDWDKKPNSNDPNAIIKGATRAKGDFSCVAPTGGGVPAISQEKETKDDGSVVYKGIVLSFPEDNPFKAGDTIVCSRKVAYEEMFPADATIYRVHFEAEAYPLVPKMQQNNGGDLVEEISIQGNDARLFPVQEELTPGGGTTVTPGGTNPAPGPGATTPKPGGGELKPNPGGTNDEKPGEGSSGGDKKDGGSSGGIGSIALGILPLLAIVAGMAWLMMPKQGVGATLMYFPAEGRFHFV